MVQAVIYQGKHRVLHGCIHCSATRTDWMDGRPIEDKKAEIKRWHLDRGWRDIGYHWLIDRDGKKIRGRAETAQGAGVTGHNRGVIHVCLFGGHGSSETDAPSDNYTDEQMATLTALMGEIEGRAGKLKWTGHNQHAAKACPGFNVPAWMGKRPISDTVDPRAGVGATGAGLAAWLASQGETVLAIVAVVVVFGAILLMRNRK